MSQRSDKKRPAIDPGKIEHTETVHHVGSRERRKREPAKVGQLNLTSMMDVTFQLLIFFVLTAQFVIDEGILPADLPQGAAASESVDLPKEPLTLKLRSVNDECIIEIAGSQTLRNSDFKELYERLNGWRLDESNPSGVYMPDNPIVIQPTGKVRWGDVVNTFNQCARAKYVNVNFAQAAPG